MVQMDKSARTYGRRVKFNIHTHFVRGVGVGGGGGHKDYKQIS